LFANHDLSRDIRSLPTITSLITFPTHSKILSESRSRDLIRKTGNTLAVFSSLNHLFSSLKMHCAYTIPIPEMPGSLGSVLKVWQHRAPEIRPDAICTVSLPINVTHARCTISRYCTCFPRGPLLQLGLYILPRGGFGPSPRRNRSSAFPYSSPALSEHAPSSTQDSPTVHRTRQILRLLGHLYRHLLYAYLDLDASLENQTFVNPGFPHCPPYAPDSPTPRSFVSPPPVRLSRFRCIPRESVG